MQSNSLHIICRNYQVCLPETAETIILICEMNCVELPKNYFWATLTTEILCNPSSENVIEIITEPDDYAMPLFNFNELLQLADKIGFADYNLGFCSDEKDTQITHYGFISGESGLPNWYAEALAQFILLNFENAKKLNKN